MKSPAWPGLTVTLCSADGEALPEHDVGSSEAEDHNPSGYVECTAGQIFKVKVKTESCFQFYLNDLSIEIYFDGTYIEDVYLKAAKPSYRRPRIQVLDGVRLNDASGNGIHRKFSFGKLETGKYNIIDIITERH